MEGTGIDVIDVIIVGVVALVAIVAVERIAGKIGVAAPLLLVLIGVAVSFIPQMPDVHVEPELILAGVLPPLLYSSAAAMPSMDFRRDFSIIGGLSILLVLVSSVVVGWVISLLIPDLGLATGIALAAVLSPSDAVATSIVKKVGVAPRLTTILEGESLFNDASSLAVMKAAIAAAATSVSLLNVAAGFVYSVVAASIIGVVVAHIGLLVRSQIENPAASTAVSFTVPFIAYIPAEHIGASGLVAVAAAGLVTGNGTAKYLRARDRHSETSNWATVGFLLEGGVFMLMGLELRSLIVEVHEEGSSVWAALWIGAIAALVIIAVRALFFVPMLTLMHRKQKKSEMLQVYFDRLDILVNLDKQAIARVRAQAMLRGANLGLSFDGRPIANRPNRPNGAPAGLPGSGAGTGGPLGPAGRLGSLRPTEITGSASGIMDEGKDTPVDLKAGGPGDVLFPSGGFLPNDQSDPDQRAARRAMQRAEEQAGRVRETPEEHTDQIIAGDQSVQQTAAVKDAIRGAQKRAARGGLTREEFEKLSPAEQRRRMRTVKRKSRTYKRNLRRWARMGGRGRRSAHRPPNQTSMERFRKGWKRRRADVDYFLGQPLGPKEGVVLVWAGMRGVVTLAAATALPSETPHRSLLILIAFVVAAGTLLIQGSTLEPLVKALNITHKSDDRAARAQILGRMGRAGFAVLDQPNLQTLDGEDVPDEVKEQVRKELKAEGALTMEDEELTHDETRMHRDLHSRILAAQRTALLDAKSSGEFTAEALQEAQELLDLVEMRQEEAKRIT